MSYLNEFVYQENPRDLSGSEAILKRFLRNCSPFTNNNFLDEFFDKTFYNYCYALLKDFNKKKIKNKIYVESIQAKLSSNTNIKFYQPNLSCNEDLNLVSLTFTVPLKDDATQSVNFTSFAFLYDAKTKTLKNNGDMLIAFNKISYHGIQRFFQRSKNNSIFNLMINTSSLNAVSMFNSVLYNKVNDNQTMDFPTAEGVWMGATTYDEDNTLRCIIKTFVDNDKLKDTDFKPLQEKETALFNKCLGLYSTYIVKEVMKDIALIHDLDRFDDVALEINTMLVEKFNIGHWVEITNRDKYFNLI
jgi:hypothetical protein